MAGLVLGVAGELLAGFSGGFVGALFAGTGAVASGGVVALGASCAIIKHKKMQGKDQLKPRESAALRQLRVAPFLC